MRSCYPFLFVLIYAGFITAQISPGDLTKAHAKLEGMGNCTKCHVLGEQVNNSKCLDCHSEIKQLMNENTGFHSSGEVKGKNCWSCHSEHNGRNFRIINFNKDTFDHNKTSFPLTGKHKKTDCFDCHQSKYVRNAEFKKRNNSFIGLDKKCRSCHEDYHQNTLGNSCENCHETESFRPALKFNHNNAKFKLTGAHVDVKCINCHLKINQSGKEFQKFTGLAFSNCISCHKDIHEGKLGANCQGCHVTTSFKTINKESFNHDKTSFPLLGKHHSVSCNDCHKSDLAKSLKHEKCVDCHKDYHKSDFVDNGNIKDCSNCHNVFGFKPSTFTIEAHSKLKFPLTGAHLATPCEGCHYKKNEWKFKDLALRCTGCHENVHKDEITEVYMPNKDCSTCHQTKNWLTIIFDHNKTNFLLAGKHSEVMCGNCHYKDKKEFKFVSLDNNCETCHMDIHFGQFKNNGQSDCLHCHTFNNWKPEKFNHDKTNFSLKGAHQKLNCNACHKRIENNGNSFIKFKLEDFKCVACHS